MTTAETEYSRAKTSVWWDIENCEVPKGWDAHAIAQNVSSALLNMNYCGPVSISAYGDTNQIPHAVQQALSSTGVGLNHVPAGVKDASDKKILVDMLLWAVDNPAPANFMLISGDRDFSNALHQLSMRRYTILLAQPPRASAPLVAAAKNVWLWTSLASGGPPLTSGESSRLVNNGRCLVSNSEALKDPVSEQAQSSKPTDSTSDAQDSKDKKTRDTNVPRGLPQETKRNMIQNGRRATVESVASGGSFEAHHHSDKRHASQAAFVASHKAHANVSAKLIQGAAFVPRPKAQANVSAKPIHDTMFVAGPKAQANVSAKPIHDTMFVAGPKSQANVSAKPIQEAAFVLNPKAQAYVSAKLIQEAALVATHKAQANVSSKPIQEAALVEPVLCNVCQITCASKDVYAKHTYGKRHRKNLELQSVKSENMSHGPVGLPKEVLKKNASKGRTKPNGDFPCRLCNVVCQSQVVFDSHLKGHKHAAMLSQSEALIDSKKLQEKGVREKDQPSEGVAEPKPNADYACRLCNVVCQSQVVFDSHLKGQKHAAMLSQSEALIDSKKLQEKGVSEKDQPREALAEPKPNADYACRLCNVVCQSQVVFDSHLKGQKHAAMLSQSKALIDSKKLQEKGVREKDQPRVAVAEPKPNADYACRLCNVVCPSQIVFDSHLRGKKHATMLSQSEALIDSKNLQEEVVGKKEQPRETIAEPQSPSQNAQNNTKCFEKHVAMDNQSEALIDSMKLQEKGVGEKDQPREATVDPQLQSPNAPENSKCFEKHDAILNQSEALVNSRKLEGKVFREKVQPTEITAEPQSQTQNTQENTKLFEKPNEEFREINGTSKSSVKEKSPRTKDWVGTVFNGGLRCEFGAPEEARECFDGIVKPVNLSKGAAEKETSQGFPTVVCDMKGHWTKQNHTTPAFVANDGTKSSVSTKPITKEPEVLQPVWCQVCQISCNSKVLYANHTYGKKHRQKLELQKVLCKNQTAFESQNHAVMVKEQTEALIAESMKIQEEHDQEKETTEEHTLLKMDDHVLQGAAQEDKEEVKEINPISENLSRAFTELNRETRILKESRGCLDVIPERVQLPTDVNVTEKLEDESKHKPQPKPQEPGKESAGLKEHPGEATKREETKVPQVDNFWTRLWGK